MKAARVARWLWVAAWLGVAVPAAQADDDKESLRNDALLLMGACVMPAGIAAYCNKYVEQNDRLIAAAVAWNKRNDAAMKRTLRVFNWAGGMSDADRQALDRAAFEAVKESVESEPDRAGYCRNVAEILETGQMDLDKSEGTAPAFRRIMAAEID
jgi:hypothetical protein